MVISPGRGSFKTIHLDQLQGNHCLVVTVPGFLELSCNHFFNVLILAV